MTGLWIGIGCSAGACLFVAAAAWLGERNALRKDRG